MNEARIKDLAIKVDGDFKTLLFQDKSRIVSRFENHGRRKGKPARLRISDVGSSVVTVTPPNPTDGGVLTKSGLPLYAPGGPVQADINQGEIGDCWTLSGAGALCLTANGQAYIQTRIYLNPANSAQVIVAFTRSGVTTLVTMDELESSEEARDTTAMWPEALEKAYAFFRTGADTYASLDNGLASGFWSDFGLLPASYVANTSAAATIAALAGYLKAGQPCTMLTPPSPGLGLVPSHCFMVESADPVAGLVLRNPWGSTAGQLLYTITPAQLIPANLSYYEYGAAPPVLVQPVPIPTPVPPQPTPMPVPGVVLKALANIVALPGTIQATQFTCYPVVLANQTIRNSNGLDLGFIVAGDQAAADINTLVGGIHNLSFSCSTVYPSESFDVYCGNVKLGTITVTNTGSWTTYKPFVLNNVNIPAGNSKLSLVFNSGNVNVASVVVS